jgi:hypothetical protein
MGVRLRIGPAMGWSAVTLVSAPTVEAPRDQAGAPFAAGCAKQRRWRPEEPGPAEAVPLAAAQRVGRVHSEAAWAMIVALIVSPLSRPTRMARWR